MVVSEGHDKQSGRYGRKGGGKNGAALRYILVVVLIIATAVGVFSLQVTFTDPSLEAVIRVASGRQTGRLFTWHLSGITRLDASGRNISDLHGIGRLKNLRWLNLEDNHVKDVKPLAALRRLEHLSLRNNGIICLDDIDFIALIDLPLSSLSLRHNVVRYTDGSQRRLEDITVLAHFKNLESLELRDNHITDASPLSRLANLQNLDISQNPLIDKQGNFLLGLVVLEELNLRECGMESLDFLAETENLRYLNIHSNSAISSFHPLANLKQLETLIMANIHLGDHVGILANFPHLIRLNIRNTGVEDLTVLGKLMAAGALQDRPGEGIMAAVDIEGNPIPHYADTKSDGYESIRKFWQNIHTRNPKELPL